MRAGVDDFVTLVTLLSQPKRFKLLGVTLTDADCMVHLAVGAHVCVRARVCVCV